MSLTREGDRGDYRDPAQPAFGKPQTKYPTPNIADWTVIEELLISPETYRPIPPKSPHPDYETNGLILVWQGPVKAANNQVKVLRVYSTNGANEDWFNYSIKYSGDVITFPVYLRTYIELRENYAPLPKAAPLKTVMLLKVTEPGTLYPAPPAVVISGGGGTGATARAIMYRGTVFGLELVTAGQDFTSNPDVAIAPPGGGGVTATAIAQIQPVGAVLVKEETERLDSSDQQMASLFVRVHRWYELLPGPWIPFTRYDDNLGPIQGKRRAILSDAVFSPVATFNDGTRDYTWRPAGANYILAGADPDDPNIWIIDPASGGDRTFVVVYEVVADVVVGHWKFQLVNGIWTLIEDNPEGSLSTPPVIPDFFDFYQIVTNQGAREDGFGKTTYEARDGSAIVAWEIVENWDGLPYGKKFSTEIEDNTPSKFRADTPTKTFGVTERGQAQPPELAVGELSRSSEQVGRNWKRDSVTSRDPALLPKTLIDQELGGVQAKGSEFGGKMDIAETLADTPQTVDEGFYVTESSVKQLGRGKTLKRTVRLGDQQGASLLLTNPGSLFNDDPAVIFDDALGGPPVAGAGAAATPIMSPIAGGVATVDQLDYLFDGDNRGVFFHLGWLNGNGTWRNPHTAGDIEITADGAVVGDLAGLVDRQPSNTYTNDTPPKAFYFDLKAGRTLLCNKISFRQRSDYHSTHVTYFQFQGTNTLGVTLDWHPLADVIPVPAGMNTWKTVDVPGQPYANTHYRRFRIIPLGGPFTVGEVELYGELKTAAADFGNAVTGVNMTDGGHDYVLPPTVVPTGGGGTGFVGVAVVSNGAVIRVDVVNPGTGYDATGPTLSFVPVGGVGAYTTKAFAHAVLTASVITSFVVDIGGTGWVSPPVVRIVSATGSGGIGLAHITGGVVTSIDVINGGGGYLLDPTVALVPVGSPEADAIVGWPLSNIAVVLPGSLFNSPPTVHVGGDGVLAAARAVLGFGVAEVVINARGDNYSSNPTPVFGAFSGGSGASGTSVRGFKVGSYVIGGGGGSNYLTEPEITVAGGGIYGSGAAFRARIGRPLASIFMTARGGGYTSNPDVLVAGDGTGATGTAVRSFAIATIVVGGAGGTGYGSSSVVTVDAPTGANGRRATAHAVVAAGVITSIVIDDPGYGYLTAPGVTITDPVGTGATATTTLAAAGAIDSITLTAAGTLYSIAAPILIGTISSGGGTGAAAESTLDLTVAGPIVGITIVNAGTGYTVAPILTIVPGTSGGTGATVTVTLSSVGQVVAVTMVGVGSGYVVNVPVVFTGGGGAGAGGTGLLAPTGKLKSIVLDNVGEGFTFVPPITISGGGGSGATGTASLATSNGKIKTLTLTYPGPPYNVAPIVSFLGGGGVDAAALYLLARGYPTLIEKQTDATEGIRIILTKDIVEVDTPLPAGFAEHFPLNRYRSIQIVSKVDLTSLPPPDVWSTTQHIAFPPILYAITPIWDQSNSRSNTNNGLAQTGSSAISLSVHGSILVMKRGGFRGAALGQVQRQFFFGPPPLSAVPLPTIIRPSSGTATIRGASNSNSRAGSTAATLFLNQWGQPIHVGDLYGYGTDGTPIYLQDGGGVSLNSGGSGASSSTTQIVDINDVMTPGLNIGSDFTATADNNARITGSGRTAEAQLYVQATARGSFSVSIPGSCPAAITPGMSILAEVGVEKWRFGLYVRTLIFLTAPGYCDAPTGS